MPGSIAPSTVPDDHSRNIAVVDDDTAVRESMRFLLEAAGFHVCTYDSAGKFLDDTRCGRPLCLIVDHNMPSVSGLDLLVELRARGIVLPVALMTAAASPELRGRATALGARTILTKPLTGDELLRFVSNSVR